jgi:CYTH domain-containing protein
MPSESKYARIEWERRFVLERFPSEAGVLPARRIVDRYIDGTRLRLRHISDGDDSEVFKLTQKIPELMSGARRGLITTLYLSKQEFDVLAELPAKILSKTRYSVPPFGVDVFEGTLNGLILAEAEFDSAEAADAMTPPSFSLGEVTDDHRFSGGVLVAATRAELRQCLAEYGGALREPPGPAYKTSI